MEEDFGKTVIQVTAILLIWIIFIDGKIINEFRLIFHQFIKIMYYLYLAVLILRRSFSHLRMSIQLKNKRIQDPNLYNEPDSLRLKKADLHIVECLCALFDTGPYLQGAFLSFCACFLHILQMAVFLLVAPLRTLQRTLLSEVPGGKESWEEEKKKAREEEFQVLKYLSVYCQDPYQGSLERGIDKHRVVVYHGNNPGYFAEHEIP